MSAKKISKTTKAATEKKTPKAPKAEQAPQAKKQKAASGKLSALDAAAKVLGETAQPMTSAELIEAMATKGFLGLEEFMLPWRQRDCGWI